MKVSNITNAQGNKVPNQFVCEYTSTLNEHITIFQSYQSIVAQIEKTDNGVKVTLDPVYWNYSRTTSKHRSTFLGESTKETEKKIKEGVYILANLN